MKRNTTQNLFLRYDDIYSCIIAKLLKCHDSLRIPIKTIVLMDF